MQMQKDSAEAHTVKHRKRYWLAVILVTVVGMTLLAMALEVGWRHLHNVMKVILQEQTQKIGDPISILAGVLRNCVEAMLWFVPCYQFLKVIETRGIYIWLSVLFAFVVLVTDFAGIYQVYPIVKTSLESYLWVAGVETFWYISMWYLPLAFLLFARSRYQKMKDSTRMRSIEPEKADSNAIKVVPSAYSKYLWANMTAFFVVSPVATFLVIMNIFAEAEIFIFVLGVPVIVIAVLEFRKPKDKRPKWSMPWLFIFILTSYSIVAMPQMIIVLMKEFAVGGDSVGFVMVVVLYNIVMTILNVSMGILTTFMADPKHNAMFRLLTQVFDDIYGDVVFLFLREFGPVFWIVISLKAVRIFARDTGLGVKFSLKFIKYVTKKVKGMCGGKGKGKGKNVVDVDVESDIKADQKKDKDKDTLFERRLKAGAERSGSVVASVVLTNDMRVVTYNQDGEEQSDDEFQTLFSFTAVKFVSEISASILVPWLILVEVVLLPEGGCTWSCDAAYGADGLYQLLYMYLIVIGFKLVAYFGVSFALWKRLLRLTGESLIKSPVRKNAEGEAENAQVRSGGDVGLNIVASAQTPGQGQGQVPPIPGQVNSFQTDYGGNQIRTTVSSLSQVTQSQNDHNRSTASIDLSTVEEARGADVYGNGSGQDVVTRRSQLIMVLGNYVVGQLKDSAFYYFVVLNMCLIILVGPVYHTVSL